MILFIAMRYAFPHSKALKARSWRIMLTASLSLVVVIVVISVMNFLQSSRFDSIRDVRSFDCTVDGEYAEEISDLLPSATVFVYAEGEAMTSSGSYLVRYIDSSYDGGIRLCLGDTSSLTVPLSFYRTNGFGTVSLYMLRSGTKVTALKSIEYQTGGIYYTALGSEFDDTMLFLPLTEADENAVRKTAVKGADDSDIYLLREKGYTVTTWKEAEKSLYGAFLVEKALMYAVLSLLFIIIAVSMKSSVVLFYSSRRVEMAELEIMGMETRRIRLVSLFSFLIVIILGIVAAFFSGIGVLRLLEIFSENSSRIITLKLSMPYDGFAFFSLFMAAVTVVFTHIESRRREKMEISGVLYAE